LDDKLPLLPEETIRQADIRTAVEGLLPERCQFRPRARSVIGNPVRISLTPQEIVDPFVQMNDLDPG